MNIHCYAPKRKIIKVYFALDSKDTTFYINTDSTTRLVVGSSAYKNITVGTDEDDIWTGQCY